MAADGETRRPTAGLEPELGPRLEPGLVAVSLGVGFVMAVWASVQRDAAATAELRFLSLVATAVVMAALHLDSWNEKPGRTLYLPLLPLLLITAVFVIPTGPYRGAAVGSLLALSVIAPAMRSKTASRAEHESELAFFLLFALACQWLLRPDEWISLLDAPALFGRETLSSAFRLLVIPLFGGLASAVVAHHRDRIHGILTLTAIALCLGQLSLSACLVLLGFAATLELLAFDARSMVDRRIPLAVLGVAMVGLLIRDPELAVLALVGCAAFALRPGTTSGRFWPALLLVVGGFLGQIAPRSSDGSLLFELLLLTPLLIACICLSPSRRWWWQLFIVLALAVVGLRSLEPSFALLVPAIVAAIGVGSAPSSDKRAAIMQPSASQAVLASQRLGQALLCLLLFAALCLASYPWLRASPLGQLPSLARATIEALDPRAAVPKALITWPAVTLSARRPMLELPCSTSDRPLGLVIDSALANGQALARETAVATVRVLFGDQPAGEPQTILSGRDTDEWSARRNHGSAVEPWLTWIDASPGAFGQRYRARLWFGQHSATADTEVDAQTEHECRVEFRLSPELPPETELTLFHAIALHAR